MDVLEWRAMRPFALILAFVLPAIHGCTPAAQTTAIKAVEASCVPIVSALAPMDAPLCVFVDELGDAVAAYVQAHQQAPTLVASPGKPTVVPAEIHAALAKRPGVMARRASPPVCK